MDWKRKRIKSSGALDLKEDQSQEFENGGEFKN